MVLEIKQAIVSALQSVGATGAIELSTPPKADMGDLAWPCFALAKERGGNPAALALELAAKLQNEKVAGVSEVRAFGPYVNFFLDTNTLAAGVIDAVLQQGEAYGQHNAGAGKKVMIEYPSQNTHKEFHIGHLRNVCIGNTLVQLFRAAGYQVQPVNYINDFGAHVAKCLWGIQKWHAHEEPKPEVAQRWLGEVYAEASIYLEDNPEAKSEVDAIQMQLEAHDPAIWPLFEKTRDWSLAGFKHIQAELGCAHKVTFLESQVKARGQELVDELLKKGIATEGERGAIIIDLSADNLDIALVRKATGAGVYMTSDLALAEQKFSAHDIAESINITAIEQNFYFKQLFRVLRLNGFTHQMTHIGYGLVTLPEGKMSSRKGNVILYEGLRDQVMAYMQEEVGKRHADWTEEKIDEVAKVLTQAVLKFTMQKHEAAKTIAFNFDEAVSFEGFSAPYLLYMVARINSILRKQKPVAGPALGLTQPAEKQLVLQLARYPEVVQKALAEYNPSTLTNYAFELAQSFGSFYHQHQILDAETPAIGAARLQLAAATRQVLVQTLDLLTIQTVEEM